MTGPEDDEANTPSARGIYTKLNERVVAQDQAKRDLATLLAMHLAWFAKADLEHTAPNALLLGPTGVGKTHAIRTASRYLRVPLVIIDGTRLTPHGFQGTTLEDVLVQLVSASRTLIRVEPGLRAADLGLAELDELDIAKRGIVFIDEFDKLERKSPATRERNELLQRRLLQFVDGTAVTLNPSPDNAEEEVVFDTSGLLFILSGAFTNLLDEQGKRSQERMRDMLEHDHVIFEDLVRFGFMEELIARVPVVIEFSPLNKADLVNILNNVAVDPSQFYVRYLESLGVRLSISPDALEYIADRAARLRLGARGLHQVLFPVLALLSQSLEDLRPAEYLLDLDGVRDLVRRCEEKRSVGVTTAL